MEIQEINRRCRAGEGYRRIASGTGLSRNTVRKYLTAARAEGIARDGPLPTEDQLSRLAAIGQSGPRQVETPSEDVLAPWGDQIYQWLTADRLQVTRIHELLLGRECLVSYQSLRRFIMKRNWRRPRRTTVRMEDTPPGEVAEVDFGRLGLIQDPGTGRRRTVWTLLVVLGYSRHCFVWPTFSQKLEDVVAGLEAAWAFFGGVPRYLVVDNCPPAVAAADALNPVFTRGFLEYSQHRGFIVDAARVRHPRDKPKVERGVPYVRDRFFKGGASMICCTFDWKPSAGVWRLLASASTAPPTASPWWCSRTRSATPCCPGKASPYEIACWRNAKVHQDHHVQCQQALYSVPASLCPPGQKVEVRVDSNLIHIYHRGKLIKTHLRQPRGGRATDPEDYPAELTAYTTRAPDRIKHRAEQLGPAVAEYANRLFEGPLPWSRIRQGHKLLRLGERYTPQRLDAACRRALDVDLIDVRRLERILVQALEQEALPQIPLPIPEGRFARPGYVFAHVKGGRP